MTETIARFAQEKEEREQAAVRRQPDASFVSDIRGENLSPSRRSGNRSKSPVRRNMTL